ncbi:unnamed protein product [Wuchereria bancrofti]|uniref:Uncharacterized protein n=1 Tax=Wuchereria bancrofti TaxID=6293 RepID=A0A3P7DFZ0_WUCBA|nr:unnamed protein product [Wuchereria bancrofti]
MACVLFCETWPQRVRGSQWLALKTLGVGPVEASIGADLGGSSKYSKEWRCNPSDKSKGKRVNIPVPGHGDKYSS